MPNLSTAINIGHIFLNIQTPVDVCSNRALLSPDAVKAFDGIEWSYMWEVLKKFRFGEVFCNWVKLVYTSPKVLVRVNGLQFALFLLYPGMRQGCSLSLLLFAVAIQPLAILLNQTLDVCGFCRETHEEEVALYADDILPFLSYTYTSLSSAMSLITEFGTFFGFRIIWDKSLLLPFD